MRYLCCGKTAVLTQRLIMDRRSRGQTRCHLCAVRAASHTSTIGVSARKSVTPYAAGDVVANVRVDQINKPGRYARDIGYSVTYLCCGREAEQSHLQLAKRARRLVSVCVDCARRKTNEVAPVATFQMVWDLPPSKQPRPKIDASDIQRHIARVFGGLAA